MKVLLADCDIRAVEIYERYLKNLETEKGKDNSVKNWWFSSIGKPEFADKFKSVLSKTGLHIDGDSVTLAYRKKLIVNFDYHAYKNVVSIKYPESVFDFGLVYDNETYRFKKSDGKVSYEHEINDPFATERKIIGAYGIIKNKTGEFFETLNLDDIQKMRNTSTMKGIWEAWFDRMVLKSVIKRICNANFHDIVKDVLSIDNEAERPENALIMDLVQIELQNCVNKEDIAKVYHANKSKVANLVQFTNLCTERREEIEKGGNDGN